MQTDNIKKLSNEDIKNGIAHFEIILKIDRNKINAAKLQEEADKFIYSLFVAEYNERMNDVQRS